MPGNEKEKTMRPKKTVQEGFDTGEVKVFDTSIILKDFENSDYNGKPINDSMAKHILYSHFAAKGYLNADNLPDFTKLTDAESIKLGDNMCVRFDRLYLMDLNGNKFKDAVITYWLAPPLANGHCWQPHKAIIADTDKGYKISHEEFIPVNYVVDSVRNEAEKIFIHGFDYDCGNQQVLKYIRIRIK